MASQAAPAINRHDELSQTFAGMVISLDVTDLTASCEFYDRMLAFAPIGKERSGRKLACTLLASELVPNVVLRLREALGKRVGGSGPGGMLRLTVCNNRALERMLAHKGSCRVVSEQADEQGQIISLMILDGHAYSIEACRLLTELM